MKKKPIAAIVSVLLSVFILTGCGKDLSGSPYVGTWKGTTATYEGFEMNVEDIFGSFNVMLDGNGKATVETNGETKSGKWDEAENGIMIDKELNFISEGGKLTYEQDGVHVEFEKQ